MIMFQSTINRFKFDIIVRLPFHFYKLRKHSRDKISHIINLNCYKIYFKRKDTLSKPIFMTMKNILCSIVHNLIFLEITCIHNLPHHKLKYLPHLLIFTRFLCLYSDSRNDEDYICRSSLYSIFIFAILK